MTDAPREMKNVPKELYVQHCDCDHDPCYAVEFNDEFSDEGATWNRGRIYSCDIRYLHADKVMEDMRKLYRKLKFIAEAHGDEDYFGTFLADIASKYPEVKGEKK